jgi:hypothetical protein
MVKGQSQRRTKTEIRAEMGKASEAAHAEVVEGADTE